MVSAAGLQVLEEKSKVIIGFALCGFADHGLLIGGLGRLCPSRSTFIARYGLRTVSAATCSNLMSAVIAGIFFSLS
ncbi:nucleoside transporter C-terminal domain-containing protein [Edwardsiella tarda]